MKMPSRLLDCFRLSRRAYFADFLITPPITLALAVLSVRGHGIMAWVALLGLGWCAWTFYEYWMHRLVLHHLVFFRELHGLHHGNPRAYIALHPLATIIIYAALWMIFGVQSSTFMVGFSLGYIVYSTLHTIFHYAPRASAWMPDLQRRHVLHHRFHVANFGVTTGFWDRFFDTEIRRMA